MSTVCRMTVRQLGSTGLIVSPLGLGLAALGRPAYITLGRSTDLGTDRSVDTMERRCHEMRDAAHSAGIRYVMRHNRTDGQKRFLPRGWPGQATTVSLPLRHCRPS